MLNEIEQFTINKTTPSRLAETISHNFWKNARHLEFIESKLLATITTPSKNLIVNMPPRHGKSEFLSVYFPLWYLANYPDKRIIITSYQASVAESWSRRIRDMIIEYPQELGIELNKNHRKASSFGILNHRGGLIATGAGGALTGKGGDILLIDDPIKNDEEANSNVIRDKVWDWFLATALTRLEPAGNTIIVMTRWHEDDLVGRIFSQFSGEILQNWEQISLPAIAIENDPIGRAVGEPLWAERFDVDLLRERQQTIGNYWFSALYQQQPIPQGTSIFRRQNFRYYDEKENYYIFKDNNNHRFIQKDDLTIMATCDLAISTSETADYTVVLVFAKNFENDILILDIIRERFETTHHFNLLKSIYDKHHPVIIGIENVQYQKSLIQRLLQAGLPIKSLRPDKDKISRALAIASIQEAGKIYFPRNAHFTNEFERELLNFPKSKHDDQVDAFAYIVQMLHTTSGMLPIR